MKTQWESGIRDQKLGLCSDLCSHLLINGCWSKGESVMTYRTQENVEDDNYIHFPDFLNGSISTYMCTRI